jgi:hypothetical protein
MIKKLIMWHNILQYVSLEYGQKLLQTLYNQPKWKIISLKIICKNSKINVNYVLV